MGLFKQTNMLKVYVDLTRNVFIMTLEAPHSTVLSNHWRTDRQTNWQWLSYSSLKLQHWHNTLVMHATLYLINLMIFASNFTYIFECIIGHYPRAITFLDRITALFDFLGYSFTCNIRLHFKITEGIHLKLNSLLQDHNQRSLSKAHNSSIDFDRIIVLFELRNCWLKFCLQN
jgi:hypothetical protein